MLGSLNSFTIMIDLCKKYYDISLNRQGSRYQCHSHSIIHTLLLEMQHLVAVVVCLVGALLGHSEVLGLFIIELSQLHSQLLQVCPGHLFIQLGE